MAVNPFRPTFGVSPPLLVGRSDLVDGVALALQEGVGSPGRATLFTGARGTGKTVLLGAVGDAAREQGWWVITETATPGMIDRFVGDHLPSALDELNPRERSTRLKSVSAPLGLGGASWETADAHPRRPSFRSLLGEVADFMADRGAGVILSVDEVHGGREEELRELATAVQHCFSEERQVAFVAAGLPAAVDERLLRDPVITFLRRADRHVLGMLEAIEVAAALREPIEATGRVITRDALDAAVAISGRYPFLVQLLGYHVWRQHPEREVIDIADVESARPIVQAKLATLVHEPSLADVSDVDRQFLVAMAIDDGPSRIADVATRLGVDANYASQYRRRLLAAELIVAPSRGYVDFELPYMREHLRATVSGADID